MVHARFFKPGTLRRIALMTLAATTVCFVGPGLATAAQRTLTLGMNIEPTGLDPTVAAPVAIGQVTWQNIFEGLVAIDRDGKIVPQLAKSWEISPTVSPTHSSSRRA